MPLIIPFLLGAGSTGWFWYQNTSKADQEPTLESSLQKAFLWVFVFILALLVLRWLYNKGTTKESPKGSKLNKSTSTNPSKTF